MDPYLDSQEEFFSETLKKSVLDFFESIHPEDSRDPYQMVELIFNVPQAESKKWLQARVNPGVTNLISINQEETIRGNTQIQSSLDSIIQRSQSKLESENQLMIQKWKNKKRPK